MGAIARFALLTVALAAVATFAASLIAVKMIEINAAAYPHDLVAMTKYDPDLAWGRTPDSHIGDHSRYITKAEKEIVRFVKPGIWASILTAFAASLIYSTLRWRVIRQNGYQ